MKSSLLTVIGTFVFAATLPASAGPDRQAIEQARKNKRAQVAQMEKRTPAQKCAAKRLVLPLDHGPRAQTPAYSNQRRSESFEAELKACK